MSSSVITPVLERLRPAPYRGDVIAAGAVPLALAAVVIELRMTQWPVGVRLALVGLIAALILTMGWLAPLVSQSPRPYHSMLLVGGLLALIVALQLLAEALGTRRPPGAGADVWTFGVGAAIAAASARRANSAVCTLIAALAGAVAVEAFVVWVFAPSGLGAFRTVLLLLTLGFAAGAIRLRDGQRRHAVALINAAGLSALVLAASYVLTTAVTSTVQRLGGPPVAMRSGGAPFGWELFVLAVGFGLIAYAGADREPGPAYIGVLVLLAFAELIGFAGSGRGSLLGWPLFLLVIGGVGLSIGLRPSKPLPPPPATAIAPTIPLREDDEA